MIKEVLIALLITFLVLYNSPYIGMFFSFVGVVILLALPFAALVVLLTPSFRSRFLSA